MRIRRPPVEKARIELIPMIDTMAFLLVFFMIASLAMSQQAGLPVNLPRAEAADSQTWGDRSLVVTLESDGRVYLNKEAVARGSLAEAIRGRLGERPDLIVVINADEGIRHGEVVAAMDAAKNAGAARMAIATRPRQEKPGRGP
ncbi:MAG TPA: biopolymer transporter ExbD [Armatimonadota bacterium]|nr:biopolymer transporter ExbD [Armatimonadota bacterium]